MELYSAEEWQPLGLVVIDADGLKMLNDNLGHEAGDRLIQLAASITESASSTADGVVARIGGDEFAVLVPNCSFKILQDIGDELIKEQEQHNAGSAGFLSLSYGYALSSDVCPGQLFATADEAMYNFKRTHGEEARRRAMEYIEEQK